MNAKEYIEERFDTDWTIQISSYDLEDLLESYHKSKVEAISDEMIEKEFPTQEKSFFQEEMVDRQIGAKWFKEQLLKQ